MRGKAFSAYIYIAKKKGNNHQFQSVTSPSHNTTENPPGNKVSVKDEDTKRYVNRYRHPCVCTTENLGNVSGRGKRFPYKTWSL